MFFTLQNRIINSRNPLLQMIANHVILYPTPVNFGYAYSFGSLVGIFFALQILTGIFLAMHYTAHTSYAFASVVHIMMDVKNGYLLRYMHANGASMIFILIYIHIGRGLYYRSYIYNRRHLWWSGIVIFLLMIITAFIGYVLPWGQMSFWGATVITSLVTAVPFVGETIAYWIWGGFSVSNATLIRFFSLHYLLPFIITGIIFIHLILLHAVTSTNPTQVSSSDKMSFHPYFTFKDLFALTVALLFFLILVHFYPNVLGHSDNFIPANPLVTPPHIVPEWYFTPFYAILRSCPNKLGGVIFMLAAILILFVIPFYKIPVNTIVAPLSSSHKLTFWIFVAIFFTLLFLGGKPATAPYVLASQFFTFAYFVYLVFFIAIIPIVEKLLITEYQQESLISLVKNKGKTLVNHLAKKKYKKITPQFRLLFNVPLPIIPKQLVDFYHIWPLHQWISSLISLVILYLGVGYLYNKFLSDKGGWLNLKKRFALIAFDLILNLGLGIYYMNYRQTFMGKIMLTCPIAISPGIFLLELFCVYFYYRMLKSNGQKVPISPRTFLLELFGSCFSYLMCKVSKLKSKLNEKKDKWFRIPYKVYDEQLKGKKAIDVEKPEIKQEKFKENISSMFVMGAIDWTNIIKFYNIWPLYKWIFSLIIIVGICWTVGFLYNMECDRLDRWRDKWEDWFLYALIAFCIIAGLLDAFDCMLTAMVFDQFNTRRIGLTSLVMKCPVALILPYFMCAFFMWLFYRWFVR